MVAVHSGHPQYVSSAVGDVEGRIVGDLEGLKVEGFADGLLVGL